MNLEELLSKGLIYKIKPSKELAIRALRLAERDLRTAKKLLEDKN